MNLRVLTADHLRAALDMPSCIRAMRGAFAQLSSGGAEIPVRTRVELPAPAAGVLLAMPGALADPAAVGAKLVTVVPGNVRRGLPAVSALVVLLDPETGRPRALLDGEWLTALRTGAGSGLATDLLARPDASVLAVVGAGVQARTQIQAVRAVRPIREIRVVSRGGGSARRLVQELLDEVDRERDAGGAPRAEGGGRPLAVRALDDVREAVAGAHVLVTATDAEEPVLPADAVHAGVHLNAVGAYRPDMRELPGALVTRARVVVDQREAALAEAGDLVIPVEAGLLDPASLVELGEVVLGREPGRRSADEVTVFKSVGSAAQDLAAASLALSRAEAHGLGTEIPWG